MAVPCYVCKVPTLDRKAKLSELLEHKELGDSAHCGFLVLTLLVLCRFSFCIQMCGARSQDLLTCDCADHQGLLTL